MRYIAYNCSGRATTIDYSTRNESAGIIGSIGDTSQPLASADTQDGITTIALAHLCRHPLDTIYIADSNGLLYEILVNQPYRDARSANGESLIVAWTCFIVSILSFFATLLLGLGYFGLILLAAFVACYLALVRWSPFNEIEAAAVTCIFLCLAVLLIPAVNAAWTKYQNRTNKTMHRSPTCTVFLMDSHLVRAR